MLTIYVDDSVEMDEILIVGGYLSTEVKWKVFSHEWRSMLNHAKLAEFKMQDLWFRRANDELWEHVGWFYGLIKRHVDAFAVMAIPLKDFDIVRRDFPYLRGASNPYFWALKGLISGLAQDQELIGIHEPVNFIFDERGEKRYMRAAWETYKATISERDRLLTGSEPQFRDSEQVLPLQAADLIAWWFRKYWLEHGTIIKKESPFPIPWGVGEDMPFLLFEWTKADMEREFSRVSRQYLTLFPQLIPIAPNVMPFRSSGDLLQHPFRGATP